MKHEDFGCHELHCVKRLVRFVRGVIETNVFENSEEKEEREEYVIGSNSSETPIHATTQEGINDLLDDGHEVDYDRLLDTNNKPIPTGSSDQSEYKEGWKWIIIYHRRIAGC